jgi:hypothetical protein
MKAKPPVGRIPAALLSENIKPERRFSPPWSVEELDACFVVKGQRAIVANHFL